MEAEASEDAPACRVCMCGDEAGALVTPCACRGSIGHVHAECLQTWRGRPDDDPAVTALRRAMCPVCHTEYTLPPPPLPRRQRQRQQQQQQRRAAAILAAGRLSRFEGRALAFMRGFVAGHALLMVLPLVPAEPVVPVLVLLNHGLLAAAHLAALMAAARRTRRPGTYAIVCIDFGGIPLATAHIIVYAVLVLALADVSGPTGDREHAPFAACAALIHACVLLPTYVLLHTRHVLPGVVAWAEPNDDL